MDDLDHPIEIIDAQHRWTHEFDDLAARLREVMGNDALRIDHIGSTSVPGLAAKDIVDIQVTIERFDDSRHRPMLEEIGLTWSSTVVDDHRPPGAAYPPADLAKRFANRALPTAANVHLRVAGRFNQRYPLLCRDYLRAHPSGAAAYGQVKRALATIVGRDIDAYYAVKDPVFDVIMTGAEDWAGTIGWDPGPSDR